MRSVARAALLAACCACLGALQAGAQPAPAPAPALPVDIPAQQVPYMPAGRTMVNICVQDATPHVFCSGLTPKEYSGFDVTVLRQVVETMGWTAAMQNWTCWQDRAALMAALLPGGACDVVASGIRVSADAMAKGIQFSWPLLIDGLVILAPVDTSEQGDPFFFFDAFSWQVWTIFACTLVVCGVLIWALDFWSRVDEEEEDDHDEFGHLGGQMISMVGKPLKADSHPPRSKASYFVLFGIAYLCMFMLLHVQYRQVDAARKEAAKLTTSRMTTEITGLSSLPGKTVGTSYGFAEDLANRGVAVSQVFPWNTAADEEAMMQAVKNGSIDALIHSKVMLNYRGVMAGDCTVKIVGDPFDLWEQAFAINAALNTSGLVDAMDAALQPMYQSGEIEQLAIKLVSPADMNSQCTVSSWSANKHVVVFGQVSGLWIILGICVLLAVIFRTLHHLSVRTHCLARWREKQQRSRERVNARLNAWIRRTPPEAQAVVRSPSSSSDGKQGGIAKGDSAQDSPRVDDAALAAELRRLLQLVESRSAGEAAGEAAC